MVSTWKATTRSASVKGSMRLLQLRPRRQRELSRGMADHHGVDVADGTCSVPNCTFPVRCRGFCALHEGRLRAAGLLVPLPSRTTADRFWTKVIGAPAESCWLWNVAKNTLGYGNFYNGKRSVRAHRWSYEYLRTDIPPGLVLDHLCEVPSCVNPWHLEPVTQAVNIARGPAPVAVAAAARTTHCSQGHEYTPENTSWQGAEKRQKVCRTCQRRRGTLRAQQKSAMIAAATPCGHVSKHGGVCKRPLGHDGRHHSWEVAA